MTLFLEEEWPPFFRNAMMLPTWLGDINARQHNVVIVGTRIGHFIETRGEE